ncbi:hypothetical protein [Microtetraspora niveoalba]|uniref:hypothetical protein n=1 Tax=Microtetraspora niveoalba TaxID=46175 RepID=UPI0008302CC6|nr:hypothetical protein [Microtetraspora niveoalba]
MGFDTDGEKEPENWKSGIGDLVAGLLSFWAFGIGTYEAGESDRAYGPVRLIVWTLVSIGVAAAVSAVRITLFGEPRAGWGIVLIPLVLPMVGAVSHRPRRWQGGAIAGVAAGVLVAVWLGVDMGSSVSAFWGGFIAVAAGFLVCSAVFAAVARPRR